MKEYNFGGGHDLYHLAMATGYGEIKVYLKKGIDSGKAIKELEPSRPIGFLIAPHLHGEWIKWSGGECPVPKDTLVDVRMSESADRVKVMSQSQHWVNLHDCNNITHYRLHAVEGTPTIKPPQGVGGDITRDDRQTGRTTKQIKNAPKGSVFINLASANDYIPRLCCHLGRNDLQLKSPRWLDESFYGHARETNVIVDHAVELTTQQSENLKRFDKPEVRKHDDHIEPLMYGAIGSYIAPVEIKDALSVVNTEKESNINPTLTKEVIIGEPAADMVPSLIAEEYLDYAAELYGIERTQGESDSKLRERIVSSLNPAMVWDTTSLKDMDNRVDNSTDSGNMDTQFKQQEEIQMTTRNLMTATLIDNDAGLEIDQSLVYSTEVMVEGSDTQTAIQELIFTDVVLGERIAEHNKKRKKTVNLEVLERTGQEVFLRPKKISELTWSVK